MTSTMPTRFWAKVKVAGADECWPWLAGRSSFGYGSVKVEGRAEGAHRVAWRLTNGRIPKRKWVLHSCDNPPCCNPNHLFIGTRIDNIRDMITKGRDRKSRGRHHWAAINPPVGVRNSRALLTTRQVRTIRRRAKSRESITSLARQYAMSEGAIRHIVKRRNWSHVQ